MLACHRFVSAGSADVPSALSAKREELVERYEHPQKLSAFGAVRTGRPRSRHSATRPAPPGQS